MAAAPPPFRLLVIGFNDKEVRSRLPELESAATNNGWDPATTRLRVFAVTVDIPGFVRIVSEDDRVHATVFGKGSMLRLAVAGDGLVELKFAGKRLEGFDLIVSDARSPELTPAEYARLLKPGGVGFFGNWKSLADGVETELEDGDGLVVSEIDTWPLSIATSDPSENRNRQQTTKYRLVKEPALEAPDGTEAGFLTDLVLRIAVLAQSQSSEAERPEQNKQAETCQEINLPDVVLNYNFTSLPDSSCTVADNNTEIESFVRDNYENEDKLIPHNTLIKIAQTRQDKFKDELNFLQTPFVPHEGNTTEDMSKTINLYNQLTKAFVDKPEERWKVAPRLGRLYTNTSKGLATLTNSLDSFTESSQESTEIIQDLKKLTTEFPKVINKFASGWPNAIKSEGTPKKFWHTSVAVLLADATNSTLPQDVRIKRLVAAKTVQTELSKTLENGNPDGDALVNEYYEKVLKDLQESNRNKHANFAAPRASKADFQNASTAYKTFLDDNLTKYELRAAVYSHLLAIVSQYAVISADNPGWANQLENLQEGSSWGSTYLQDYAVSPQADTNIWLPKEIVFFEENGRRYDRLDSEPLLLQVIEEIVATTADSDTNRGSSPFTSVIGLMEGTSSKVDSLWHHTEKTCTLQSVGNYFLDRHNSNQTLFKEYDAFIGTASYVKWLTPPNKPGFTCDNQTSILNEAEQNQLRKKLGVQMVSNGSVMTIDVPQNVTEEAPRLSTDFVNKSARNFQNTWTLSYFAAQVAANVCDAYVPSGGAVCSVGTLAAVNYLTINSDVTDNIFVNASNTTELMNIYYNQLTENPIGAYYGIKFITDAAGSGNPILDVPALGIGLAGLSNQLEPLKDFLNNNLGTDMDSTAAFQVSLLMIIYLLLRAKSKYLGSTEYAQGRLAVLGDNTVSMQIFTRIETFAADPSKYVDLLAVSFPVVMTLIELSNNVSGNWLSFLGSFATQVWNREDYTRQMFYLTRALGGFLKALSVARKTYKTPSNLLKQATERAYMALKKLPGVTPDKGIVRRSLREAVFIERKPAGIKNQEVVGFDKTDLLLVLAKATGRFVYQYGESPRVFPEDTQIAVFISSNGEPARVYVTWDVMQTLLRTIGKMYDLVDDIASVVLFDFSPVFNMMSFNKSLTDKDSSSQKSRALASKSSFSALKGISSVTGGLVSIAINGLATAIASSNETAWFNDARITFEMFLILVPLLPAIIVSSLPFRDSFESIDFVEKVPAKRAIKPVPKSELDGIDIIPTNGSKVISLIELKKDLTLDTFVENDIFDQRRAQRAKERLHGKDNLLFVVNRPLYKLRSTDLINLVKPSNLILITSETNINEDNVAKAIAEWIQRTQPPVEQHPFYTGAYKPTVVLVTGAGGRDGKDPLDIVKAGLDKAFSEGQIISPFT